MKFYLNQLGIKNREELIKWWETSTDGSRMLWYAAKLLYTPYSHGGGQSRKLLTFSCLQCIDDFTNVEDLYSKAYGWYDGGGLHFRLHHVRKEIFNIYLKAHSQSRERSIAFLVAYCSFYNSRYTYVTAYDIAFDKAISVLKPSVITWANIMRENYTPIEIKKQTLQLMGIK